MNNAVVLVVASEGYQPVEYSVPKKILESAGIMVTVASDKQGKVVAADGSTSHADLEISAIPVDQYGAVVFIGGPGAMDHLDNPASYKIIKSAYQAKKIVAAICIAPRIFAKAGILKGKRATGWDGDGELAELFKNLQVTYEPRSVVIDGNIITATGPSVAHEFGVKIVEALSR